MEMRDKIKELRESTGMNRKEFCEYFGIPYRTVTEWERGTRKMPDYVFRLLAYRIKMGNFAGKCIRPLSAAIRAAFSGQTGPY